MTFDKIRDDALATLGNYGDRFRVTVEPMYPGDDELGSMTITALGLDEKPLASVVFTVREPSDAPWDCWEFETGDSDNWHNSGELWEILCHRLLDQMEKGMRP